MHIPNEALILVADGEKALFLRNKGDAEFPNLVIEGKKRHENPPTGEQGTDRPGKTSRTRRGHSRWARRLRGR